MPEFKSSYLSYHSSDELKVADVLLVDIALWTWLIGST
jgi:hypothetical protein